MLDVMNFASDRAVHRFQRKSQRGLSEEEPQTVFVDMQVDADEELETKYVNLYIETGGSVNCKSDQRRREEFELLATFRSLSRSSEISKSG